MEETETPTQSMNVSLEGIPVVTVEDEDSTARMLREIDEACHPPPVYPEDDGDREWGGEFDPEDEGALQAPPTVSSFDTQTELAKFMKIVGQQDASAAQARKPSSGDVSVMTVQTRLSVEHFAMRSIDEGEVAGEYAGEYDGEGYLEYAREFGERVLRGTRASEKDEEEEQEGDESL